MSGRVLAREARSRLVLHLSPVTVERLNRVAAALKRSPESVALTFLSDSLREFIDRYQIQASAPPANLREATAQAIAAPRRVPIFPPRAC